MNQKKNKGLKIAIIIVLVIILILLAIMAVLYFFTDLFMSNKELFFKYTAQLVSQEDGFIDDSLEKYIEKKKNTPYEDNGSINFDVLIPDMGQDNEALNNFNISFSGKIDNANTKLEENISLNYSDNVNFPFYYRKVGDIQGIQTDNVGSRYVAIKDNEELQGVDNLNLNTNLIENNVLNNIDISNEELQNMKTTYFDNIFGKISEDKFSQVNEQNKIGYKLTLTSDELKNIITQILETLKKDENTLNKLNDIFDLQKSSSKLNSTNIDSMIEELNDTQLGDIEITVYKNKGILSGIYIKQSNFEISLEKNNDSNELSYNCNLKLLENSEQLLELGLIAKYTGLNSNNIEENYEITINGNSANSSVVAQAKNNQVEIENEQQEEILKSLINESKVDKLASGGDMTQITEEDINNVISSDTNGTYENIKVEKNQDNNINITFIDSNDIFVIDSNGEIVDEISSQKSSNDENDTESEETTGLSYKYVVNNTVQFVDSINIEDFVEENSIILNDEDEEYVTNLINAIRERLISVNKSQMEELGLQEDQNPILYISPFTLLVNYEVGSFKEQISEAEVAEFNNKFTLYEGTSQKGVTVRGLLSTIALNNGYDSTDGTSENNNPKITEIHFDGEEYEATDQNITLIKDSVETESLYRVEFELDSNTGRIYRVVINKQ